MVGLSKAIRYCDAYKVPLRAWMVKAIQSILVDQMSPHVTRKKMGRNAKIGTEARANLRHYRRWATVRELHERKEELLKEDPDFPKTWPDVYEAAAEILKNTSAKGSPDTIAASYKRVQKDMRDGKGGRYFSG